MNEAGSLVCFTTSKICRQ